MHSGLECIFYFYQNFNIDEKSTYCCAFQHNLFFL